MIVCVVEGSDFPLISNLYVFLNLDWGTSRLRIFLKGATTEKKKKLRNAALENVHFCLALYVMRGHVKVFNFGLKDICTPSLPHLPPLKVQPAAAFMRTFRICRYPRMLAIGELCHFKLITFSCQHVPFIVPFTVNGHDKQHNIYWIAKKIWHLLA